MRAHLLSVAILHIHHNLIMLLISARVSCGHTLLQILHVRVTFLLCMLVQEEKIKKRSRHSNASRSLKSHFHVKNIFMLKATHEQPIDSQSPAQGILTSHNLESTRLYVGELDLKVNESDLLAAFSELGKISSHRIARDAITGVSLGYGFIEYNASQTGM